MTKRILISVDEEESRIAVIDNTRLLNLEIESNASEGCRGNIYKGVIHKVEPSLQAAFVDFGEQKQGFLPVSEVHHNLWPEGITEKRPDISKLLRNKQEIIVQVVKDEVGTKGATLTTCISLPGRYLVLMPESDKHGISRRLGDTERRRLKEAVDSIGVPDGFGVIIRTAGQEQRPMELKKDLLYLTKLYETIESRADDRKIAGLIYRDRSHPVRFVRDYFQDDMDEVWVNQRGTLKEVSDFMQVLMPDAVDKLRLYEGETPMFIKFAVEDQIESVFARRVELQNGGSIVLDQTEALVAIDVNSGRVKGEDIEETALAANLEAADELARQVVIRDLGGLIVVDFIDMRDRKHGRLVEQRIRKAFSHDKAKIKFGRISEFGLMELSRQRLRKSLFASISRRCDSCDGTGHVRAPASAALSLLRRMEEACLRGNVKYIRATAPVAMANMLLNRRRKEMLELESNSKVIVEVIAHNDMPPNLVALDIVMVRSERSAPQRIYQLLDLIRNEVIRRETSPLPKPEAGFEALELDHTAIYRAVAQRDAVLQAERCLEEADFDFHPREPEFTEPDDTEDSVEEPTPEPVVAAEKDAGGFLNWMKRVFSGGGGDGGDGAESAMKPVTEEAVAEETRRHDERRRGGGGGGRSRSRRRGGGRSRGGGRGGSRAGGLDSVSSASDGSEGNSGRRGRSRGGRGRRGASKDGDGDSASASSTSGRTHSSSSADSSSPPPAPSGSEGSTRGRSRSRGKRDGSSSDTTTP